ncbi:MAG: aminotransferase class III-fold pyridoxal phosphate-dependent enzyme [Cytophagales bacterium]|nr:aminotransferase class III-fold pyridoxal phosphate-dependent enzyme [Cytophagales bacterium]
MSYSIEKLLADHFDLHDCEIKGLVGYANSNYLIKSRGERFVFKTYRYDEEELAIIGAENELLLFLQRKADKPDQFPMPVSSKQGEYLIDVTLDGVRVIGRMLSFLSGDFSGDHTMRQESAESLGTFLAEMDLLLKDFDHPLYKGRAWEWDIQHLGLIKKYVNDIPDQHQRSIVRYFIHQFEVEVAEHLPQLRKQVIHNDANEMNLLQHEQDITGIIDFGDATCSPLINELAVALTYACYDKEDPLHWLVTISKSYHRKIQLKPLEVDLLYYLIAARLCLSVCNSAHARKVDPDNTYATVSEDNAWSMLHKWLETGPTKVSRLLRESLGLQLPVLSEISEKLAHRNQHLSETLSVSYSTPIWMERAAFQYMYDSYGNAILDAYNNIPHVGHCHPHVVERASAQMARLNTNTRYLYDQLTAYAEQLLAKFPKPLNKVFFVNSGSAATDLALRLVRKHTGSDSIMVLEHGYHGNTQLGIDVSDYKFSHARGQGQQPYIHKTALPDTYRGKYGGEDAGMKYATDAVAEIRSATEKIVAFIAEPIVGCGGQVPLAEGYLKPVYAAIRAQGGLCISDEVQTGFGRVGDQFWGFEQQGVVPDLVILGKPMGNGHPIGAVVTTDEVAASFEQGVEFFSSFGGNPVSCVIGQAVLDVIENEGLQHHARTVGDYYQQQLRELSKTHPCIGDVRGSGLFIGIDIVKPGTTGTDRALASHIKNFLRSNHILISTDGPDDSVLKTKPPMCFNRANVDQVVDHIDQAIKVFSAK